jgi:hypothetical protein
VVAVVVVAKEAVVPEVVALAAEELVVAAQAGVA